MSSTPSLPPLVPEPTLPKAEQVLNGNGQHREAMPKANPAQPSLQKAAFMLNTVILDWVAAGSAWMLFFFVRRHLLSEVQPGYLFSLSLSTITIATFWVLVYAFTGMYQDVLRRSRIKDAAMLSLAALVGIFILLFFLLITDGNQEQLGNYLRTSALYLGLHVSIGLLTKVGWLTYLKRQINKGAIFFNTILVGSEDIAREVYQDLTANNPHLGIRFVGFVHADSTESHALAAHLTHLGHYTDLERIIEEAGIEQAIIATEPHEHALTEQVLNHLEGTPVRTYVLPDMYQILLGAAGANHILGTPLIEVRAGTMPVWQQVVKRLMDIGSALLAFTLFSWVFAFAAVITWASSPGPVFFTQYRVGRRGRPFKIYKFRSMYTDAEKHGPKLSSGNDPRITPWGRIMRRSRLDELPQFWNVLIGDMSLVGPRPERQFYIDQIVAKAPHYKYLNRVRPGITSLGQVKFGYAENVDQMIRRLRYDIIYIENMSIAMDLRILVFTVMIVLRGKGK